MKGWFEPFPAQAVTQMGDHVLDPRRAARFAQLAIPRQVEGNDPVIRKRCLELCRKLLPVPAFTNQPPQQHPGACHKSLLVGPMLPNCPARVARDDTFSSRMPLSCISMK